MKFRSGLRLEWSAAGTSLTEHGVHLRWTRAGCRVQISTDLPGRAVCAVVGEVGVALKGPSTIRTRTAALFNALSVRRLLKGRVSVSRANIGRRLSMGELETLQSAQK